uniref:Uncharacterized protein n=1 Tax=Oryza brachyantha TaxID=4533 RepID=J3M5I4_ORYBR
MFDLLTKKTSEKEQKKSGKGKGERAEIHIDGSYCESVSDVDIHLPNEVLVVKKMSSEGSASGGTIDKFYKHPSIEESVQMTQRGVKVQTTLTTQKREKKRDIVCEYICQWFYEAGIAHNTVPCFYHMLEAIGEYRRGLRKPSPYEMGGPFLQKRKQKVLDGFVAHKGSCKLTGCIVMIDA